VYVRHRRQQRAPADPRGRRKHGGRWSPDGQSIAFVSDRIGRKKAGVEVEFARYPGANHGFRRDCFARTLEWFRERV
jgi:dipeptidyl aminopeptidase/acylaminoacyl peptidase